MKQRVLFFWLLRMHLIWMCVCSDATPATNSQPTRWRRTKSHKAVADKETFTPSYHLPPHSLQQDSPPSKRNKLELVSVSFLLPLVSISILWYLLQRHYGCCETVHSCTGQENDTRDRLPGVIWVDQVHSNRRPVGEYIYYQA